MYVYWSLQLQVYLHQNHKDYWCILLFSTILNKINKIFNMYSKEFSQVHNLQFWFFTSQKSSGRSFISILLSEYPFGCQKFQMIPFGIFPPYVGDGYQIPFGLTKKQLLNHQPLLKVRAHDVLEFISLSLSYVLKRMLCILSSMFGVWNGSPALPW